MGSFRVTNPRLFGSVLHKIDREDSGLDLLVDPMPEATLFDLSELEEELKSRLGIAVQVLTHRDLSLRFRAEVLAEAQPV